MRARAIKFGRKSYVYLINQEFLLKWINMTKFNIQAHVGLTKQTGFLNHIYLSLNRKMYIVSLVLEKKPSQLAKILLI